MYNCWTLYHCYFIRCVFLSYLSYRRCNVLFTHLFRRLFNRSSDDTDEAKKKEKKEKKEKKDEVLPPVPVSQLVSKDSNIVHIQ